MRNIIVLIAIMFSFGTFAQEAANKSRIGLAGSAYLNFDKKYESNSQYFELSYDYLINKNVRFGLAVDYNLTTRKMNDVAVGIDSVRNTEISRSGLGAHVYLDYIFIAKEKWDVYARAGLGATIPVNIVTTETTLYQGNQISEIESNQEFTTWLNPVRVTIGVGAEYKIKDYLAIGLEINYRSFGLNINQISGVGAKLGVYYKF